MFEGRKHTIINWYLEINGEMIQYRKKTDAIRHGIIAKKINPSTKLLKHQRFYFGKVKSERKLISNRVYDRSFLIIQ